MADYEPPLAEIRFVLKHVCGDEHTGHGAVIEAFGRFVVDEVLPLRRIGDVVGSCLTGGTEARTVTTPPGFRETYARYVRAGWGNRMADQKIGGGGGGSGFPLVLRVALREMLNSGNMAFALAPLLTQGAVGLLAAHGTAEQQRQYLPNMLAGDWTATMDLTEADAGSDVGAISTRAVRAADGTFRLTGRKTLITYGDHDLAENIIHFVLARIPGAPEGSNGVSCFLVPKYLLQPDTTLGRRNGVQVTAVVNKLGIRAAPACDLAYDDAVGFLVGKENHGLHVMFTMMNTARLGVGAAGLGLCEAAWQRARHFAQERRQGRASGSTETISPIVQHPDVRRMLLTMKASTEALRAVVFFTAAQTELGRQDRAAADLAALLTPVAKAWGADLATEVTSTALQVFGGLGYCEDIGVAQLFRDARVISLYEGTNGIQGVDLVSRKLPMGGGAVVADLLARIEATVGDLQGEPTMATIGDRLADALEVLRQATAWIAANGAADPVEALGAAMPYLRLLSLVVGGWLMGIEALAATHADPATLPTGFAAAKVATSRFFAHHLLPTVHGLLPTITAGQAELFALRADEL